MGLAQSVLESLEDRAFAVSGSPYRLTDRGKLARLTGLSSLSVIRLETALAAGAQGWLPTLPEAVELTETQRLQIARTVYESTETMSNSLWLRRTHRSEPEQTRYLSEFASMQDNSHLDSDIFWAEVNALALWIGGESLESIAETMPTFGGSGLFGSSRESSRVSDVAEYVSRIGYPGSWTWTAAQTLARELHKVSMPSWISAAVEYGGPSETAIGLMRGGGLSRPAALRLGAALGPQWAQAAEKLRQGDEADVPLGAVDRSRLATLRATLQQDLE